MLVYILAIAIVIGSLGLYLAAFLFPDLHRRDDFLWSGVGLFYALVLWVCAGRITGGVLLGQTASVLLLSWFGWQVMIYRRAIARPEQQAEILKFSLLDWIEAKIRVKKPIISTPQPTVIVEKSSTETQEIIAKTKTDEGVITTEEKVEEVTENKTETEETLNPQTPLEKDITSPNTLSQADKKGFSFGKLINSILAPFDQKTVKKETKSEIKEILKDDIWEEEIVTKIVEKDTEKEPEQIKPIEENKPEEIIEKSEEVDIQEVEKIESESTEDDNPFKELTS